MKLISFRMFIMALLIILSACDKTPDGPTDQPSENVPVNPGNSPDAPTDDPPEVTNQYVVCKDFEQYYCEVPDIVCESGDHSCRSPAFMTLATEQECQMLADWAPGVDIVLFLRNREESKIGYFRIDKDGIMHVSTQPHLEESLYMDLIDTSINDGWIFSGDCDMHVISSAVGFDEVQWRGVTL